MTEQRTERYREIASLVRTVGLSPEEAERRLEDGDLWMIDPETRFVFAPGEEDIGQWRTAADFAEALAQGFTESAAINDATRQLLWEMQARADEGLSRARKRARRASDA